MPDWVAKHRMNVGKALNCGNTEWSNATSEYQIRVRQFKDITIRGLDRSGHTWRVGASYAGDGGCRFYSVDLDGNGYRDLIFLTANMGSGAAGVTMTVIAFDQQRRPVPWRATGPFSAGEERIDNIVDLDGDGRAELLFQSTEEQDSARELAVVTFLYRIERGYFKRVDGNVARRSFPIRRPKDARISEEPELSNVVEPADPRHRISAVKPGEARSCWLDRLSLTDGAVHLAPESLVSDECHGYLQLARGGRVGIPMMVVLDKPNGERIIDVEQSDGLLREVVRLKVPLVLVGTICETGCRPYIAWAGVVRGEDPLARQKRGRDLPRPNSMVGSSFVNESSGEHGRGTLPLPKPRRILLVL